MKRLKPNLIQIKIKNQIKRRTNRKYLFNKDP